MNERDACQLAARTECPKRVLAILVAFRCSLILDSPEPGRLQAATCCATDVAMKRSER